MSLKTIEDEWRGFSEMIFDRCKPSDTQRVEMRKAFYAGAWAVYWATREIGQPHVTEAKAMEYLDRLKADCEAFKKQLMAEYAETN